MGFSPELGRRVDWRKEEELVQYDVVFVVKVRLARRSIVSQGNDRRQYRHDNDFLLYVAGIVTRRLAIRQAAHKRSQ